MVVLLVLISSTPLGLDACVLGVEQFGPFIVLLVLISSTLMGLDGTKASLIAAMSSKLEGDELHFGPYDIKILMR